MFKLDQIKDGVLKRFLIQIPSGNTLFKQNDKGNTLYILVEGEVRLIHKEGSRERAIATLRSGEVVGEKALLSAPYRRSFTAVAETNCVALEFDSQSLKAIASKIPDFTLKLMQAVVERLDRANSLIAILQLPSTQDRVKQYVSFFARHYGRKVEGGLELDITPDSIHSATNVDLETINQCLKNLVSQKTLATKDKGYLFIDENAPKAPSPEKQAA